MYCLWVTFEIKLSACSIHMHRLHCQTRKHTMHFILILLSEKSICWGQPAIGAEMKGRGAVFSRNTLFCCFLLLLLCLSFSTDLALCICSHNSEVWQRLMASNLVSLAKAWHFHMDHWVNMFERERGGRDKSWVCVSMHPSVLPASCC